MNFRHCWIISVQNGKECKARFNWDIHKKKIIKAYDNGGHKNKPTKSPNGTTIILESSLKVSHPLQDFVIQLEKLARIRHILKSQKVVFRIVRKGKSEEIELKYNEPDESEAKKVWQFALPENLKNKDGSSNELILRYFEKPLKENAFVDLTDGISSVADLIVSDFDGRPFSSYVNGNLTICRLQDSVAVKENRRGLEEGDDLTEEIHEFLREKVREVINQIEEIQKQLDKERRINSANEKLKELSKFLSKQDLKFKQALKELRERFSPGEFPIPDDDTQEQEAPVYRKPLPDDPKELLIMGRWIVKKGEGGNGSANHVPEFVPDDKAEEFAVKVGSRKKDPSKPRTEKRGLQVLMSNDPDNPESPTYTEHNDPVSDSDMKNKGIIWINAVHPIIVKYGNDKEKEAVRNENIANFVLMIVAQYYAQKEVELQPEDERDDPLLLFRKHFFELQKGIRADEEISYFESDK